MIFDNDAITAKVKIWQNTYDSEVLESIMLKSNALIEVIVSRYPSDYREDLIQECRLKLLIVLQKFDVDRGKLHSFLTTVFNNCCKSFVSALNKTLELDSIDVVEESYSVDVKYDNVLLKDLIIRNRKRFSSVSVNIIDVISTTIYFNLINDVDGKSRKMLQSITAFGMNRYVASIIYRSSLVYLRNRLLQHTLKEDEEKIHIETEMSLLVDFKEYVGEELFSKLSILFSGAYIKFP
jgi:hypothetical protein